ncbi:MAG: hypothetical protein C4575_12955 [Desulforudis sp.]|jgi:hypothetical protein|nr:MAG: hypothetical protein C4575_12955 [Desulforudis sp.]
MARSRVDTIYGIERDPQSEAKGDLVCPVVFIWKKIGGGLIKDNVAGAFKHGDSVIVIDQQIVDGFRWCKVRGEIVIPDGEEMTPEEQANGGKRTLTGWLRSSLLKDYGAAEYGG